MPRLTWVTDPHLNFVDLPRVADFLAELAATPTEAILLSGDITEAPDLVRTLSGIAATVARPVLFVLGNHDFYRGSIQQVRADIRAVCTNHPYLRWLPMFDIVPVSDRTCVVGHDGWGDGRLGDYWQSPIALNDWRLIDEFAGLDRTSRWPLLNALGDEAAAHLRKVLPLALSRFQTILVVTHVPPVREACLYRGQVSDDNWLPHFTCGAVGKVTIEIMSAHPDRHMVILCGHTHEAGEVQVLPNLQVLVGGVEYGCPRIQRIWEVE
jgi:3',5'-cyclic AMP phosphodiesterase CpdA